MALVVVGAAREVSGGDLHPAVPAWSSRPASPRAWVIGDGVAVGHAVSAR